MSSISATESASRLPFPIPSWAHAFAIVALLSVVGLPASAQWHVDELRFRLDFMSQDGRGVQSQADVELIDGVPRGRESAQAALAVARIGVRQNERVRHVVDIPVDIVTSASADALDVISRASLWTESFTMDGRTQIDATPDDHLEVQWGVHLEEVMKGGFGGLAYRRDLADDNATIEVRTGLIVDMFDPITPQGFDYGYVRRKTFHGSVAASQILSPTTWAEVGYGLTHQWGVLATTWNGTPATDTPLYSEELFPESRTRHALTGGLAQFLPATRSALRLRYRFYADDFDVRAHTLGGELFQWLGQNVYARLGYRFHRQSAVNFFYGAPTSSSIYELGLPRTSDSDLAAFDAHEWSIQTVFFLSRDGPRGQESIDITFRRYSRPYFDLATIGLGYGRVF